MYTALIAYVKHKGRYSQGFLLLDMMITLLLIGGIALALGYTYGYINLMQRTTQQRLQAVTIGSNFLDTLMHTKKLPREHEFVHDGFTVRWQKQHIAPDAQLPLTSIKHVYRIDAVIRWNTNAHDSIAMSTMYCADRV